MTVLTAGDIFQDLIFSGFSHYPALGEEVYAQAYARAVGGGAAITACGLARLGISVGLVGSVGALDGEWIAGQLAEQGVDTSLLAREPQEPTGITVSVSTVEDRAMFTYAGANRSVAAWLRTSLSAMARAQYIHLAWCPYEHLDLLQQLQSTGCFISLDVGWHPQWLHSPQVWATLRHASLFLPNEREATTLTGEPDPQRALLALVEHGVARVALKCGAEGALLAWDGAVYQQAAPAVDVVDTTGAGDCFNAGFLAALYSNASPQECLRQAVLCGALSVRGKGGIDSFPSREELEGWKRWPK